MNARAITLAATFLLASCGGQSSTQQTSADPARASPRPVRIESDEVDARTLTVPPVPPSGGDAPLTSGALADPPPVEPP